MLGPLFLGIALAHAAPLAFGHGGDPTLLVGAIEYGIIGLAIGGYALDRVYAKRIFDVTATTLALANVSPLGARRTVWSRERVIDIKLLPDGRTLFLRISGIAIVEFQVSPNPEVAAFVAETLREAVFRMEFVPSPPEHGGESQMPGTPLQRRVRLTAITLAALAAVTALVIGVRDWIGWPNAPSGPLYTVLGAVIAAVACGLYFGTQEREYYL